MQSIKTGHHDITEILLKVASLKHQKSIKSSICFKDMSYIYYIILSFPLSVLYLIVCPYKAFETGGDKQ
jgi:hypothetical protein